MLTLHLNLYNGSCTAELARLEIVNDRTGTPDTGHYHCTFTSPDATLTFPLRNFSRKDGAAALAALALQEVVDSLTSTRARDEWLTDLPQPAPTEAP